MKKIIALILSLLMLMPTVYADTAVSGELEKVLVSVKNKIDVPAEFSVFESNISKYDEKEYYNFSWYSPDYNRSVRVSADGKGNIRDYYYYSENAGTKRISPISKKEIIAFAENFIKKSVPEMYTDSGDVLVLDEKGYSADGSLRYTLTFRRRKNDIEVKDNFVSITVCITDEGKLYIRSMSANLDLETSFEESGAEIENFAQKYRKEFPVELVYQNEYNPEWKEKGKKKYNGVLIYRIQDNDAGYIHLLTGEKVTEDKENGIISKEELMDSAAGGILGNKNEASLTPEELKEITAVEGLMSVAEIEKKVKALPYIKFPEGVKLESSNLSKNDEGKYVYNLGYTNGKDGYYSYLRISAYAVDGKLISINQSFPENRKEIGNLTEYQREVAREKTEKFLTAAAEEFAETRLEKCEDTNGFVNFNYPRRLDGVKHINEGIKVTYDAENAVITSYSLYFTNTGFASPQTAITDSDAYDKMTEYSPVIKMYVKVGGKYICCATLEKKGVILDAFTGEIKNAYKEQDLSFTYNDIKGHWAEVAAEKLSEIQVGFEGGKLNPDSKINQEKFLRFIASGIYGKYYHTYETDDLYENLVREKVISEEEKNPDSLITRENAFVYIIRMAGLEKVAKLRNIYKSDYADSNLLSEGKIGYCAILSGMGVICGDGGNLRPQDEVTFAETVTMLYRYLLNL